MTCGYFIDEKIVRSDRDQDHLWIFLMGAALAVVMLITLTGLLYAFSQTPN